jgi:group I intron endonuclease
MIISGIYSITNKINGKRYIGQAEDFNIRWGHHRSTLRRGTHHLRPTFRPDHLQAAWNKHGEAAFVFEILEHVQNSGDLTIVEQYYIDWFDSADPKFGYNIRKEAGCNRGLEWSEYTKKKMSDARKGSNHYLYGKHLSEDTKARISESLRGPKNPNYGKHLSDETKAKISVSKVGKSAGTNNPFYGKRHSKESLEKMSISKRGEKHNFYGKHHSKETCAKISKANSGSGNHMYGKHHSEETRAKMSASHLRRKRSLNQPVNPN